MPSDPPDDDMSNPAFSQRQLEQLDKKLDERGFNAIQHKELDELFRVFFAVELKPRFDLLSEEVSKLSEEVSRLSEGLSEGLSRLTEGVSTALGTFLEVELKPRFDALSEDRQRSSAANKDLPVRVTKLEEADLDGRVSTLEAAVFPPKPHRRKRT